MKFNNLWLCCNIGCTILLPLLVVVATYGAVLVTGPCQAEDSINCFWDAGNRGNGIGQSFLDIGGYHVLQTGN